MKKLAAIDLGTNSFHLIVVHIKTDGTFETIDQAKEVVRLGEGFSGDIKNISREALERAIAVLKTFKGIADVHNAEIRAIATSAVREAANKQEFKELARTEAGIEIEVISGVEEARIIYLGILKALPIYDKMSFSIDIGGGSTEFIIGFDGNIAYSNSLKLGAVRLSQKFFPDGIVTKKNIEKCRSTIEGIIDPVLRNSRKFNMDVFVGSSGTITNSALMILAKRQGAVPQVSLLNNFEFSDEELFQVEQEVLACKTTNERKLLAGLETKRADIIPAGILILATIFRKLNIKKMVVSGYALREGIVVDSLFKTDKGLIESKLKQVRQESIKQLAESCEYDLNHCYHVTKLSLQIFNQLQEVHQLGSADLIYLESASILHDIGYHISHSKHHLHANYIIRFSELLGFNETEILVIANIARYHRKSHPKKTHQEFAILTEQKQLVVKKLSAILRVADALDRSHSSKVTNIVVENNEKQVTLKLTTVAEPDIELWSLGGRKLLFEEVFNKKLVVEVN